ncbi:MAG TPA: hypothetical protein VEL05_12285, partial [Candidatus Acidoferrum sp.]|nr:hypothetical protein [Candidatus Acidoferrum sp.]
MRGAAFGFAIAAAVIAAASRPARAGSCGRGSGSSSGGGHGGTGVTGGPACRETTDVVGRRECGHFGAAWAGPARQPPITTEVAFFTRWLDTGFGVSGAMAHDTGTFDYQVSSRDDRDTVVGAALRVGSALPAHLYLGADFEVGGPVSGNRADV